MGGEDTSINAYLSNTTLEYTFTVTPSETEDKYEITQTVDFTTNVPTPVVSFEGSVIQIPDIHYGESLVFNMVVTNHGLVAAQGYSLTIPNEDYLTFEILNPTSSIAAQSSYEFIIRVTADAPPAGKSTADYVCYKALASQSWLTGYSDGSYRVSYATLQTNQEYCTTTSTPGNTLPPNYSVPTVGGGGIGGGSVPTYGGGSSGGSSAPSVSVPIKYETVSDACTPCRAAILNVAAQGVSINRMTLGSLLGNASAFLAGTGSEAMAWAAAAHGNGSLSSVLAQRESLLGNDLAAIVE